MLIFTNYSTHQTKAVPHCIIRNVRLLQIRILYNSFRPCFKRYLVPQALNLLGIDTTRLHALFYYSNQRRPSPNC